MNGMRVRGRRVVVRAERENKHGNISSAKCILVFHFMFVSAYFSIFSVNRKRANRAQYLCVYFFWSNFLLVLMFVLQFYIVWNMHQSELNSSIDLRCGSHIINTQFTVIGANIMACRVCCRIHRNDWIILQLHMDIVIYICSGAELRSSTTATNHSGRSAMWTDGNNSRPCLATRAAGYNIWITNRSRSNTSGEIGIYAWRGTSKSVAFRSFFAHTKINKQKKNGISYDLFSLILLLLCWSAGWLVVHRWPCLW